MTTTEMLARRVLLIIGGVYLGIGIVLAFGLPRDRDPELYVVFGLILLLANFDFRGASR